MIELHCCCSRLLCRHILSPVNQVELFLGAIFIPVLAFFLIVFLKVDHGLEQTLVKNEGFVYLANYIAIELFGLEGLQLV